MGSYGVCTCHQAQMSTPLLKPKQTGRYSIYLHQKYLGGCFYVHNAYVANFCGNKTANINVKKLVYHSAHISAALC